MIKKKLTLNEILKPRFYIPNFLKIRDKNANLVNFKLNKAQKYLLDLIEEQQKKNKPIRIIVLKARQLGISTFTEGLIFVNTATKQLRNSLIIAHEDSASQNLYAMYKTFYENLPPELTPMTKYSNAQELVFENPTTDIEEKRRNPGLQSKVRVASARNVNTGRSMTIHNMHCSEVAFWNDAKTLMTGLMQTVPDSPNTMVIIESTANGVGGWFYEQWRLAEKGESEFIPVFFPWIMDENYTKEFDSEEEKQAFIQEVNSTYTDKDGNVIHTEEYEIMRIAKERYNIDMTYEQLNWRRYAIRNKCSNDINMFRQEYPLTPDEAFVVSGRPRFDISTLRKYERQCIDGKRGFLEEKNGQIVFIESPSGYIEMFEEPKQDKFYGIGADVAEGLAHGDYSCAVVGDDDFNVVCAWHGHIDPDLFGKELVKLARFYNDAYLGVERNNHGLTTLKTIEREGYYNIYFQKTYDKLNDKITQKIGWGTDRRTKPLMINKLAEYIREKWLGVKWKTFIRECFTYIIEDDGTTNAQEGEHDDTVMATAIMLQLLLEGKGDSFTPISPEENIKRSSRPQHHIDIDVIDEDNKPEVVI